MMEFRASYFCGILASDSKVLIVEAIDSLSALEVSAAGGDDSASVRAVFADAISSSNGVRKRLKSSKLIAAFR